MGKIVRLRDVGCECRGLLRAETEEGLLKAVAVHATKVHGMQVQGVTPDFVEKVRTAIREEEFRFWWPREAGEWWGSFLARMKGQAE